ncbi:hypothetical protein [uncultured Erythrobacter sp.]|uniref:hypothetical protein n=1 Tax=uncultured Erythrobacter sp. TaxID=263913 RepID=UPI0026223517|nr:hypothetical protein [uncultured Erythrobacter sp.]
MSKFLIAATVFICVFVSGEANAEDTNSKSLNQWMEGEFLKFARTCAGNEADKVKVGEGETAIPLQIAESNLLIANRDKSVSIEPIDSEIVLFSEVFEDAELTKKVQSQLVTPWIAEGRPIIFDRSSSAVFLEDCVSVFRTEGRFKFNFGALKSAVRGAFEKDLAQTQLLFGGRLQSPVLAGLRELPTTQSAESSEIPGLFPTAISIWDWYRRNEEQIGKKLWVRRELSGFSRRQISNLTYQSLLDAAARVGISIPLISTSAKGKVKVNREIDAEIRNYTVVYWDEVGARLPDPSDLVELIEGDVSKYTSKISGLPEAIADGELLQGLSFTVRDVGSACNGSIWQLVPPSSVSKNAAIVSGLGVRPEGNDCTFSFDATPSAEASSTSVVRLAIESSIGEGANAVAVVIAPPVAEVADYRAALSLSRKASPGRPIEVATDQTSFNAKFAFFVNDRKDWGIKSSGHLPDLQVQCSDLADEPITNGTGATVREVSGFTQLEFEMNSTFTVPDIAPGGNDKTFSCVMSGSVGLSTFSEGVRAVRFKPIPFDVVKKASAAPIQANPSDAAANGGT